MRTYAYNEKAYLISTIVKIGMILMIICLAGVTNSLAKKELSPTQQIEYSLDK